MVFLGFFGWVFLGGFFNANPVQKYSPRGNDLPVGSTNSHKHIFAAHSLAGKLLRFRDFWIAFLYCLAPALFSWLTPPAQLFNDDICRRLPLLIFFIGTIGSAVWGMTFDRFTCRIPGRRADCLSGKFESHCSKKLDHIVAQLRIQNFKWFRIPDPDPIRVQGFDEQKLKNSWNFCLFIFWSKLQFTSVQATGENLSTQKRIGSTLKNEIY